MADKEIPELPLAGPLTGSELLEVVQGGNSRSLTILTLSTAILGNLNVLALATAILGATVLPGTIVTTSKPLIDHTQTWSDGGVTFTGWKLNVTDTASAAGSLLMDLRKGGVTQFAVGKSGHVVGGTFALGGAPIGSNALAVTGTSLFSSQIIVGGNIISSNGNIIAYGGFYPGSGAGTGIVLDGINVLAQRNGTVAQVFNIYNTWTDASNYERGSLTWAGNILELSTSNAGTGTFRRLYATANSFAVWTGTSYAGTIKRWEFDASGHFMAGTDNTYDIGASGATRPRNVYVGTSVSSTNYFAAATGFLGFSTRGYLTASADGLWQLRNEALDGFTGLLLGPSGTTYTRLKHGGTGILHVRLADDSAFASLQGLLRTAANAVSETITPTHTIVITDAAGQAYRVPCQV